MAELRLLWGQQEPEWEGLPEPKDKDEEEERAAQGEGPAGAENRRVGTRKRPATVHYKAGAATPPRSQKNKAGQR